MTRSSRHSISNSNVCKLDRYRQFLSEYREIGQRIVDDIWTNGYLKFQPYKDEIADLPLYLDYKSFNIETNLSARALRCLTTQVSSVVRGACKKRSKILYLSTNGKIDSKTTHNLLNKYKLVKPSFLSINPELNSICSNRQNNDSSCFDLFLSLFCLGKKFSKIKIPVKETKVSRKWLSKGNRLNGISLSDKFITFRYNLTDDIKADGDVVGADQGYKTILTLSNSEATPDKDIHDHSLESIIDRLSRRKKGSKAFGRSQVHRKNFIHWAINQLNLEGVREIRLEKIWNIRFKKRCSRKMSHWCNTEIRDKVKSLAQELEVLVTEQDSTYRSQRCSNEQCGIVRKANRKGKIYKCKHCGNTMDADLNAAKNHEVDLPYIDWKLRSLKHNLGNGFYWLARGLFTYDGQELTVPAS